MAVVLLLSLLTQVPIGVVCRSAWKVGLYIAGHLWSGAVSLKGVLRHEVGRSVAAVWEGPEQLSSFQKVA